MPIRSIRANGNLRRVFFFLIAGGTGFILYLAISNTLHYLFHASEVVSAAIGTVLPILPTFWMQKALTFKSNASQKRSFSRYFALQVCNAAFITSLTALGAKTNIPGVWVFTVSGMVSAIISYHIQSRLIFRTL
jgi:putative flippase GtrA